MSSNAHPVDFAGDWNVVSLGGDVVVAGSAPQLTFAVDGQFSGSGGVNRIMGTWRATEVSCSIGPVASTLMAGPDDVMDQEYRLLRLLEAVTNWLMDDPELVLSGPGVVVRLIRCS